MMIIFAKKDMQSEEERQRQIAFHNGKIDEMIAVWKQKRHHSAFEDMIHHRNFLKLLMPITEKQREAKRQLFREIDKEIARLEAQEKVDKQ